MSAIDWTTVENALRAWVLAAASAIAPGIPVIWFGAAATRPATPWISLKRWGLRRDGIGWTDTEPNPLVLNPIAVTGEASNTLHAPAHGLNAGDGPIQVESTGSVPTGTAVLTNYWAVPVDADHLQLANTFANAVASSPVTIPISDAGTGTVTLVSTADTVRAAAEVLHVVRCYYALTLTIQVYADTSQPTGMSEAVALAHEIQARSLLPSVRNALEAAGLGVYDFGSVMEVGSAINRAQFEPRAVVDAKLWVVSTVSETDTIIDTLQVGVTAGDLPETDVTVDGSSTT